MAMSERNCCKRWYIKHLALTLRAYEREHVNDFDGVVSITDNDADYFRSEGCRKPIVTIPFAITPVSVDGVAEQPGTLFHLGSMDWLPNQEGVRWFLDRVWPLIHSQMPSLTLNLAGRRMSDQLLNLQLEGVHIVGEVPDAATFIASKQINVVPLLSGSGIRVKIIEAMSQGKAVVTTTVGAQGIGAVDGRHLLIADTPERFATQIRRCVDDPAFRQTVGANARQFIAHNYGIEPLTRQLLAFYDKRLNLE
jgi:glycosyltransferase involved in cell wall biosynthesis